MGKEENQNNYSIKKDESFGQIQIADEVVAIIAGLAATEVEGVSSMAGNITNELVSKISIRNLSKGVKVFVEEGTVRVELTLHIDYDYSMPKTCKKVQEKVKAAIQNMTGLTVSEVNIRIASVNLENRK